MKRFLSLKRLFQLLLVFLLPILSQNLFCQVHWIKPIDNPVMIFGESGEWDESYIGPGSVMFYDNTYHMYYDGGLGFIPQGIGYATSPDGITWSRCE